MTPLKDGMTNCLGGDGHDISQRLDDEDCELSEIVDAKNHSHDELSKQLDENKKELTKLRREFTEVRKRNEDLSRQRNESQQQVDQLRKHCSQLRTRNEDLSRQQNKSQQQVDQLRKECNQLRTRLSEMASMQLTDGNPNIADLSDQNRPDKLAERFSELYDNEWTDCYQVLADDLQRPEEESIQILLHIVQTSYHICLERSQEVTTTAKEILFAFAGRSDTEPDKALDALIQETLHTLKSFRTKNFKATPADIEKEIKAKLLTTICEPVIDACNSFIEKCTMICWLMCIMDPPMYIFCDKEAVFDHNKYASYTKAGTEISYVVWPVLYLYKNGPLVRKGVAQGQKRDSKVKASGPLLPELDHLQDYETGVQGETKRDSDEQAKLTKRAEEMRSKDNVGLKTNVSHVSGFESNRDDPGTNQDTEEGMHQTTPKVVDSMLVQPTLECKDIENTSVDDYKELWQKDTAMSDLELMQINVVINEMEQTDNNLNVLDGY